jgi:hypothetical protein
MKPLRSLSGTISVLAVTDDELAPEGELVLQ